MDESLSSTCLIFKKVKSKNQGCPPIAAEFVLSDSVYMKTLVLPFVGNLILFELRLFQHQKEVFNLHIQSEAKPQVDFTALESLIQWLNNCDDFNARRIVTVIAMHKANQLPLIAHYHSVMTLEDVEMFYSYIASFHSECAISNENMKRLKEKYYQYLSSSLSPISAKYSNAIEIDMLLSYITILARSGHFEKFDTAQLCRIHAGIKSSAQQQIAWPSEGTNRLLATIDDINAEEGNDLNIDSETPEISFNQQVCEISQLLSLRR